jgi:hypothetical protein
VRAVDASSPLAKNVAAMPDPRRAPSRVLAFAAALGVSLAAAGARGEEAAPAPPTIYKWVDANGIAHYTTDLGRVPRSVRGSVRALGGTSASPSDGFAARDVAPPDPADAAPAPVPQPEWDAGTAAAGGASGGDQTGASAAAAGSQPGDGDDFAATDRPAELPGGEDPTAAAPAPAASAEPPAQAEPAPRRAEDLDARIAALEAEIASDEEALKTLLAAPAPADPGVIAYDLSFREVAERLPKRLAELRTLQSERAQLDQP